MKILFKPFKWTQVGNDTLFTDYNDIWWDLFANMFDLYIKLLNKGMLEENSTKK